MTRFFLAAGLALALCAACGGGSDDCIKCDGNNYKTVCPKLTKQCPGFTEDVQSCSGPSGGQACCVTDASQVSC